MNYRAQIATILCALLLAYPLAVGPLARIYRVRPAPPALVTLYSPLRWLCDHVPAISIAFQAYLELWQPKWDSESDHQP